MKIEAIKTTIQEVCLESQTIDIVVTPWGNHEGASVLGFRKDAIAFALALSWEELDLLTAAISVARTR